MDCLCAGDLGSEIGCSLRERAWRAKPALAFGAGQSRNHSAPAWSPAMTVVAVAARAEKTALAWCVTRHVPAWRSHTLSVRSDDPETTRCPSGVTAHVVTDEVCPVRVFSARPLVRSHT